MKNRTVNKYGYLGFLGFLGFFGYLGNVLDNPSLYWLYFLHLFFLFFVLFVFLRKNKDKSLHSIQTTQASPELGLVSGPHNKIEPADLGIPIYLNQQVVFDSIAVLEDGFSRLSTIKTSTSESETDRAAAQASIGASNVFALLGVSFSGEDSKGRDSQEQTEKTQERVHTPTSLFGKLRLRLKRHDLLRCIDTREEFDLLTSGEFVEFKAVLRRNPLVDTLESFKKLMEMATVFQPKQQSKGGKGRDQNALIMQQLDSMLKALMQSNSIEIIGDLLNVPGVKVVLPAKLEFFGQGDTSEIIDGEFRVLGKVTGVLKADSDKSISLLRKTAFRGFDQRLFDKLASEFESSEEVGITFPELITKVDGPAFEIIPIAIFT